MFICWIAYLGSFIVPIRIEIDENFLYLYFYKKMIKIQWGDILEFRQLNKSFIANFFKGEYYLSSKKLGFPNKLNAIFMLKRIPLVFIPKESIDHQRLIEYINGRLNHSEDDFLSEPIAK